MLAPLRSIGFAALFALLSQSPLAAGMTGVARATFASFSGRVQRGSPRRAAQAALSRAEQYVRRYRIDERAAASQLEVATAKAAAMTARLSEAREAAEKAVELDARAAARVEQAEAEAASVPEELIFQAFLRGEAAADARRARTVTSAEAEQQVAAVRAAEANAAVARRAMQAAEATAATRAARLAGALDEREMWRQQALVWADTTYSTQLEALQRHIQDSQRSAAEMRREIEELRRMQASVAPEAAVPPARSHLRTTTCCSLLSIHHTPKRSLAMICP